VAATEPAIAQRSILFVVSVDWFFLSHRLRLAERLLAEGWEVAVAAPQEDPDSPSKFNGVGVQFIPLKMRRGYSSPFSELRAIRELFRLYQRLSPSVIHHVAIKPVIYGSIAARLAGQNTVVNAVSGLGYTFLGKGPIAWAKKFAIRTLYQFALRGSPAITVFQNQEQLDLFIKNGILREENTALIKGAGVDLERFGGTGPVPNNHKVLFASRILKSKGIPELVEAIRILRESDCPVELLVAGRIDSKNPDSIAESQLDAWSAEGLITWLGYREDITELLAEARLAVLPSHSEGLPRSLLEAAAAGRPIIATDIAGCREIARDRTNARLVPVKDATALAAAMADLLGDFDSCEKFGVQGRTLAAEFSDSYVIAKTRNVYENLLEKNSIPTSASS